MKRTLVILGLVAVVGLAAGIAVAQGDHNRDDDGGPPHRMMNGYGGPGMWGWGGGRGMRGGMGMGGGMFLGPERILLMDSEGRLAEKLDLTGTQTYSITVATFGSSNATATNFSVNPVNFAFAGTSVVTVNATSLVVQFVPVPEPGWVLGLIAGIVGVVRHRSRHCMIERILRERDDT